MSDDRLQFEVCHDFIIFVRLPELRSMLGDFDLLVRKIPGVRKVEYVHGPHIPNAKNPPNMKPSGSFIYRVYCSAENLPYHYMQEIKKIAKEYGFEDFIK